VLYRHCLQRRLSPWLVALGLLSLPACSFLRPVPQLSVPPPSAVDLQAHMLAAASHVQGLTAGMRLTYFGPRGRLKASASLALHRPAGLRADVFGPHGAVVWSLAADSEQLQVLDMAHNTFHAGVSTAANFDALLGLPLHLGAAQWLALLLGEQPIAPQATVRAVPPSRAHGAAVEATWEAHGMGYRVTVDCASWKLVRYTLTDLASGTQRLSATVTQRSADLQLPSTVEVEFVEQGLAATLQLRLHDAQAMAPGAAPSFRLQTPRGMVPQRL
jgi:hypothetical protein